MVVVVSAMGKTTDGLIAMAREVAGSPPQRELDMLVTTGERISMALLSMAIYELGGDAISFTGSQSGIITDQSHQGARILEVRPIRIVEELDRGRIVIVAGYQGVSRQKEVTTLGRGGSDTTAVALAAALGADACEIYSDVDGVYSADPGLCPQARLLAAIPYETMQTIANAGARVLNADAVEFAKRAGIVVAARRTGDSSGRQTIVSADVPESSGVVAVVNADAVTRITGDAGKMQAAIEGVTQVRGRIISVCSSDGLQLLVDRTGVAGHEHASIAAVAANLGLQAVPVSVVTLVGAGLLSRSRPLDCDLQTQPLGWVGGDSALSVVVRPEMGHEVTQRLHAALIENP